MAGQFIDLRKYNIRDEEDAVEFLNLIVSKAPQLVNVMKDHQLKVASLNNRLRVANSQSAQAPAEVINPNATVLERLTQPKAKPDKVAGRLEQMKAAGSDEPTSVDAVPAVAPEEPVLPAVADPGEIGQLNVPTVAPQPTTDEAPVDQVTEDQAAAAAGSPSERTADDDVQPEDTAPVDEPVPAGPSQADITPVGQSISRKTGGDLADPASAAKTTKAKSKKKK